MKVAIHSQNKSIPTDIRRKLIADVSQALQAVTTVKNRFIVNDRLWYWSNPAGAIRPTVVNSAGYISKGFQNALERLGWEKEPTIEGQNFDAMTVIKTVAKCYQLQEDKYLQNPNYG